MPAFRFFLFALFTFSVCFVSLRRFVSTWMGEYSLEAHFFLYFWIIKKRYYSAQGLGQNKRTSFLFKKKKYEDRLCSCQVLFPSFIFLFFFFCCLKYLSTKYFPSKSIISAKIVVSFRPFLAGSYTSTKDLDGWNYGCALHKPVQVKTPVVEARFHLIRPLLFSIFFYFFVWHSPFRAINKRVSLNTRDNVTTIIILMKDAGRAHIQARKKWRKSFVCRKTNNSKKGLVDDDGGNGRNIFLAETKNGKI